MADIDNFAEINENFDTIKTLLNSIRAQGILNTSDVDKLLSGINTKLEKINTEEDIDLIKIFLSELKQNLDERHSVLVSKFGAIESLFSNLLKNSSEMLKSSEVKELFDIVATNLSVFSREVVSQKESLTDITLRLDALRSDDSQKKDIIKNIALLKPDLERLNNGFDSIVLSLNDNFKTIVKTITTIDKTEHLDKFADSLNNIEMSSNTVLSALQMLDKKAEQVEEALRGLATKEDLISTGSKIVELSAQAQELTSSVVDLADKHKKFDSLSEKIDASVGIIAGLKSVLEEKDDNNTRAIIEELAKLEAEVVKISSDTKFDEFKISLETLLSSIIEKVSVLDKTVLAGVEESLNRLAALEEANISRVLNDISNSADNLSSKMAETQAEIAHLCEKNFSSIFEAVNSLKKVVSQADENSVSANNAIFSSITDRLIVFENNLKDSLDAQEKNVSDSTMNFEEQFNSLKNLASILDYKMDSSVVEISNTGRSLSELKSSIDGVLALDFVNVVKDLRVDLYASKQDITNAIESFATELTDKFTDDLFGKYELLISKLDSVEEDFIKAQSASLGNIKNLLDNISSSIVDVLSYVSEQKSLSLDGFDSKFISLSNAIKENNLSYIESVRDIVDVIRVQVEDNLKTIEANASGNFDVIKKSISENALDIKNELKYSYSKLLEIQDAHKQLVETFSEQKELNNGKFDNLLLASDGLKSDVENKLLSLKNSLLEKISEFKNDFSVENADNLNEIKFSVENLYKKSSQDIEGFVSELKALLDNFDKNDSNERSLALTKIIENFVSLKEMIKTLDTRSHEELASKVDLILDDFSTVKVLLEKVDENVDGDMTRQLSIIESNFESLVSQITILFEKSDISLAEKINNNFVNLSEELHNSVADKLEGYKLKIEETFDSLNSKTLEQSNYIQERIAALNTAMKVIWDEQSEQVSQQIQEIAETLKSVIDENIKLTSVDYATLKKQICDTTKEITSCNEAMTQDFRAQLDDITKYIDSIFDVQAQEIKTIGEEQLALAKSANADLAALTQMCANNNNIAETISSNIEIARNDISALAGAVAANKVAITGLTEEFSQKAGSLKELITVTSAEELQVIDAYVNSLAEQLDLANQNIETCKAFMADFLKQELSLISNNVEKETDVIIAELIEQFDLLKKSQNDDVVNLSTRMEEIVNAHIYNNIEDLKSYLDVKTDNSVLTSKLDNFKIELTSSVEGIISDISKLLGADVFNSAIADFKLANEILVNSAVDRLNEKVETFINDNIQTIAGVLSDNGKTFEEKLAFFDKKFVEVLVDKFEEIKLLSNTSNDSFNSIKKDLAEVFASFETTKNGINSRIDNIVSQLEMTNKSISDLNSCFENLRSQISNKSFDEAFQASINKQIESLENLISEQMTHLEDINNLCFDNLPDVTEMNTLLKHTVIKSLEDLSTKVGSQNIQNTIEDELKVVKSDIITQFLNVFNQISFVAEEEEILDFIQDKHDELISVLSHIVTNTAEIEAVKENVSVLREDINLINEKITAIISADGDIDYVYSLQDLESDIANLRLVLNEMKENDHGQEFADLISSTNEIYNLVESIKTELPSKQDFEGIAEDILSISTRTNKLLLASDESYKSLQDNLQDFKLVINDLDERTRNFAQDAGIDRIDSKLNALNSMMQSGAKTNQVFNQVFEYLAEWVDNASVQINNISSRVESLDDITQIKMMLSDIKEKSEDNTENLELIDALGKVFDKQVKRIATLETKLDKLIVETTIKENKLDITPMENTLNKFLVAIDEKMSLQQDKINSLEEKLASVLSGSDEKNTAQLTKKVGSMDKQIAKLNKSIEKIASYVVEK